MLYLLKISDNIISYSKIELFVGMFMIYIFQSPFAFLFLSYKLYSIY
jgi:hypothetical protein